MPDIPIARAPIPSSEMDEYRSYARECALCADEASNEKHRELFLEMAQAWTRIVAFEMGRQR